MISFGKTSHTWFKNENFNIYDSFESENAATWSLDNLDLTGLSPTSFPGTLNNISDIGYNRATKRFWTIQNNTQIMREYTQAAMIAASPVEIRTITWTGLDGSDTEGVSDLIVNFQEGGYEVMCCDESGGANRVYFSTDLTSILTGTSNTTVGGRQRLTMAPNATDTNSAAEGVTFNVWDQYITSVQEGNLVTTDRELFGADRPTNRDTDYTYLDPELTVTNPFDSQALLPTSPRADQASVVFHQGTGTYLILSQLTDTIFQVNLSIPSGPGSIVTSLDISSIGLTQPEGLCFFGDDLVVAGEPDEYVIIPYVAP